MPKTRSHGDGALYEIRGGKLWRGVVDGGLDANGDRQQWYVTAKTKAECARRLNRLRAEVAEHGSPLAKSVKVEQWAPHWLETVAKPDIDPKTYAGYASLVRKWIVPTLGHRKISALKPSDVRTLRVKMTDAGRATSTVRQAHIVLSMILDAAVAEKIVRTNVANDVRKPGARGAVVVKERGSLTTEQALAILKAAAAMPDSAGSRWWFKLLVGQRQGEILGATIADLDLENGLYTVNWKLEELRREHGCGGTCRFKQGARCPDAKWITPDDFESIRLTGAWHLTRPKSRTGRVVPLIPQLVEAIKRHLAATADQPNPHGLIWHDKDGNPILPKDDAQQWRDLLANAGVIDKKDAVASGTTLTGHWARHTTVTILASLGVDFQIIGEIVGQSSVQVTAMYRHAQASEKRAAVEKIGDAWAKAIGPTPTKPKRDRTTQPAATAAERAQIATD